MNTFTMVVKMCEGLYSARFTFNAATQDEASRKAFAWARYQGMDPRDVSARSATGSELAWETKNSYVN